jgi:hypothetical protein
MCYIENIGNRQQGAHKMYAVIIENEENSFVRLCKSRDGAMRSAKYHMGRNDAEEARWFKIPDYVEMPPQYRIGKNLPASPFWTLYRVAYEKGSNDGNS